MLTIVIVLLAVIAAIFGMILGYSAIRFKVEGNPVVDQIDSLLPQTQCGQCTYPGCRPYAEAIASGEAEINRCPPGGEATINALADLLNVEVLPLDAELGEAKETKTIVVIDEQTCIGCTLCIQACPVDAILGSAKHMHTIIASECTGCNLCIPPCPVDCIHIIPVEQNMGNWKWPAPDGGHSAPRAR